MKTISKSYNTSDQEKVRGKNDIFFKSAFEDYFSDMLRFLYKDADAIFDLKKPIVFMDKELLEISPDRRKKGGTRNADMLARIHLRNGKQELFLLHLEIQTVTSAKFSSRVFKYWYRLTDRYDQPVVSLAIFTGSPGQSRPDKYHSSLLGTEVLFKYSTYQIFQHTEEELLKMNNPFALVVLVAQKQVLGKGITPLELHNTRLKIIEKLTANGNYTKQSITRFILFLNNLIHIEDKELNIKFDEQVRNLTGEKITMGIIETARMFDIQEGMERGIEIGAKQAAKETKLEEREKFVRNLIHQLGLSDEQTAKVAEVSLTFVKKIRTQLKKTMNQKID